MIRSSKTQKRIALTAGLIVTLLAVFAGEFTSHGETYHEDIYSPEMVLDIDEEALIERAIEEIEFEHYIPQEEATQTIKIYNQDYELLDIIHLNEGELVEDIYSKKLLNQAAYLSEYGGTTIYKVTE